MTWIIKAKEDLNKIIDSQCLESYLQTNRKQEWRSLYDRKIKQSDGEQSPVMRQSGHKPRRKN